LHKAALKDIGVTFLPNPDDFVVRFRSRAPLPAALGSPINFKTLTSPEKSQSSEVLSQYSQDPELGTPADTVVKSVVDSSRDPRLQSRNTLGVGPPTSVGKIQPQLSGTKGSQTPRGEVRAQRVEEDSQRTQLIQGGDQAKEVRAQVQGSEIGRGENSPEYEGLVGVEADGETGGESCGESMSEGYDSEGDDGDNDGTVQDKGLGTTGTVNQLVPTSAEAPKLVSCEPQKASQPRAPVFRSIFGAPGIINRSKSPWILTSDKPPVIDTPLTIRSAPLEAQYLSDSASSTPQKVTTTTTAKTSNDLEGSDGPHWESSTGCHLLGNDDGIATPDTHKRKRSTSLSENGGEGFSQDTPEMKRRRDNISSLKLELAKNIREKEEKMVSTARSKTLLSSNSSSDWFS
jgi:hypothetical protein